MVSVAAAVAQATHYVCCSADYQCSLRIVPCDNTELLDHIGDGSFS